MVSCPECDADFETRRGLGVHHSSVHGERLPNRTCENCGEEFYCSYEKKFCTESCRLEAVSYEGRANPNYRGKKQQTACELCGDDFDYYPSQKEGRYCASCVESKQWRSLPDIHGALNPRWNGGKQEYSCTVCDDTVKRYPSEFTGDVTVCSEDCRRTWLSESFSGDGHPNWKGGGNEPYGTGWSGVRRRALERDGFACVICSTTKEEIGRNPDVHHIIPVRKFIESDRHSKLDAHTLENVVSLCIGCHRKADFGQISPTRLRFLIGAPVRRRA